MKLHLFLHLFSSYILFLYLPILYWKSWFGFIYIEDIPNTFDYNVLNWMHLQKHLSSVLRTHSHWLLYEVTYAKSSNIISTKSACLHRFLRTLGSRSQHRAQDTQPNNSLTLPSHPNVVLSDHNTVLYTLGLSDILKKWYCDHFDR